MYDQDYTLVPMGAVQALSNPFEMEKVELGGVLAVGAGLTYALGKLGGKDPDTKTVICGALLYAAGYFVASKRPDSGWMG